MIPFQGQESNELREPFRGFILPTSNTTYTPNQFFDVCMTRCSRGCVRLVALLIRKTLGWCDAEGNPQREIHELSWADFEDAGISREMIGGSIDEAVAGHFIACVQLPVGQKAGQPAVSGSYELKWDERPEYIKDPKEFRGFFAGEGNRTYIPNQFFDHVVPTEPLAVVKVVGSVIRFSIGYQNKWGHRRQHVSLSYKHILNYSNVRDRKTLKASIYHALEFNYIERLEEGYFDPNAGRHSFAAVYAVRWLNDGRIGGNGQKTPPENPPAKPRSENPTGNGQKTLPDERSENPTGIEIKQLNKTSKQQESAASFEKLKEAGFDDTAARAIASRYSFDKVERQITWMQGRTFRSNRLGMLRKAIEEDWAAPGAGNWKKLGTPNFWEVRKGDGRSAGGEGIDQILARGRTRFLNQSSVQPS